MSCSWGLQRGGGGGGVGRGMQRPLINCSLKPHRGGNVGTGGDTGGLVTGSGGKYAGPRIVDANLTSSLTRTLLRSIGPLTSRVGLDVLEPIELKSAPDSPKFEIVSLGS